MTINIVRVSFSEIHQNIRRNFHEGITVNQTVVSAASDMDNGGYFPRMPRVYEKGGVGRDWIAEKRRTHTHFSET